MHRREFLGWTRNGLAGAALATLLEREHTRADTPTSRPATHHAPRARRAIHICACGGVSQVDTFDYKPELERLHGRSLTTSERPDVFFGQVGLLRKSDWKFRRRGSSGSA